jgi:hypothetical protein
VAMTIIDLICELLDGNKKNHNMIRKKKNDKGPDEIEKKNLSTQLTPRDGMSMESAKFVIGRCAGGNSEYEIRGIENKGRYFTAEIMDAKGKKVNELMVDKLNGRVQFIR